MITICVTCFRLRSFLLVFFSLMAGVIPAELGKLARLQYVNLGYNGVGNRLAGKISASPTRAPGEKGGGIVSALDRQVIGNAAVFSYRRCRSSKDGIRLCRCLQASHTPGGPPTPPLRPPCLSPPSRSLT